MKFIVDGHNLIAKIPGMDLAMPDDEERLIQLLTRFGQAGNHHLEVYFDGAPPGQAGTRSYGRLRAHFVPRQITADQAISTRLRKLGRMARAWTLVSSDRSVQAAGREVHARVVESDDFARQLLEAVSNAPGGSGTVDAKPGAEGLSKSEIDEWLAIFKQGGKSK